MRSFPAFLLILFFTACAGKSTTVNKEALAKVRSVAIVAYTMDYNMDLKSSLGSALMGGEQKMGMSKVENRVVERPISKRSYGQLVKALKDAGFQVRGFTSTQKSPTLSSYYAKKVKTGFLPLQSRHERLEKQGVPQYHNVYSLKGSGKLASIARELKVDALVFAYIDTDVSNSFSLGPIGLGSYSYSSEVKLDVIDPRSEEKILSIALTGDGVDEEKEAKWIKDDPYQDNSYRGVIAAFENLAKQVKASRQ